MVAREDRIFYKYNQAVALPRKHRFVPFGGKQYKLKGEESLCKW
uniref:Uncharacterized protein n=1 Tax=Arundo donax TaxID=35708 RepID=A0A0A8Z6E5_ARUDO